MATIQQVYEDFARINLRAELPVMIVEAKPEIVELITTEQLEKGLRGDGNKMAPSYASGYYSKKKFALNALPGYGIPDAKVDGQLWDGIIVTAEAEEYNIDWPVDWPSILQYGPLALTLSEQSKEILCDATIGPAITKYISEITGLVLI